MDRRKKKTQGENPAKKAGQGSGPGKIGRPKKSIRRLRTGRSQLSLAEHALFPLNQKLRDSSFTHKVSFPIFRRGKRPLKTDISIFYPLGISPYDEYVLKGLLGIAFAEKNPSPVFYARTNYILTRLGLDNGGKGYLQLDQAMDRLEVATYTAKNFYNPLKREFDKKISFGFIKRCVPLENEEERGWKFVIDQQLFDFAESPFGRLKFPFDLYNQYSYGTRRLFELLRKIFHRREMTHAFDVSYLNDHVMGYNPDAPQTEKNRNVLRAAQELLDTDVTALSPQSMRVNDEMIKVAKGQYEIIFNRGPRGKDDASPASIEESALFDLLKPLEISKKALQEVLDTCKPHHIQEWTQITLAAKERKLITKTPAAYFLYNIRKARVGKKTAPDWWLDLKKEEAHREREKGSPALRAQLRKHAKAHNLSVPSFQEYLQEREGRETFERILKESVTKMKKFKFDRTTLRDQAHKHAVNEMKQRYAELYNAKSGEDIPRLGDILRGE